MSRASEARLTVFPLGSIDSHSLTRPYAVLFSSPVSGSNIEGFENKIAGVIFRYSRYEIINILILDVIVPDCLGAPLATASTLVIAVSR